MLRISVRNRPRLQTEIPDRNRYSISRISVRIRNCAVFYIWGAYIDMVVKFFQTILMVPITSELVQGFPGQHFKMSYIIRLIVMLGDALKRD